jgi:hypothetical protein
VADDEWKKLEEGWDAARRASGSIPPLPQQNSTHSFADSDVAAFLRSIGFLRAKPPDSDPDAPQAVFQVSHRRPSEMANMAEDSPAAQKTPAISERSFNVALAAYAAVFGAGVLQLAARDWYFGPIFTVGGGLGLMSIHPLIRPKLQIMRSNRSLWAMVAATWLFLAANLGFAIYDHFWLRPFTIGVSPIEGAAGQPVPPSRRITIEATPDFLMNLYSGKMSAEGDRIFAPYVGKWIAVSGTVSNVMISDGESQVQTFSLTKEGAYRSIVMNFDKNWNDRLSVLSRDQKISAHCEISKANEAYLFVRHCEFDEK